MELANFFQPYNRFQTIKTESNLKIVFRIHNSQLHWNSIIMEKVSTKHETILRSKNAVNPSRGNYKSISGRQFNSRTLLYYISKESFVCAIAFEPMFI
jgi:hypothetical protein